MKRTKNVIFKKIYCLKACPVATFRSFSSELNILNGKKGIVVWQHTRNKRKNTHTGYALVNVNRKYWIGTTMRCIDRTFSTFYLKTLSLRDVNIFFFIWYLHLYPFDTRCLLVWTVQFSLSHVQNTHFLTKKCVRDDWKTITFDLLTAQMSSSGHLIISKK